MSNELIGPISFLLLILGGILSAIVMSKSSKIEVLKADVERARKQNSELSKNYSVAESEIARLLRIQKSEHEKHEQEKRVFEERSKLFPWLASAFADLTVYQARLDEQHLFNKSHPAAKAADKVREYSQKLSSEVRLSKALRYRLLYLESSFPWIQELTGDTLADYIAEAERLTLSGSATEVGQDDPVRNFLADAEFKSLSPTERNQLALDRWKKRKKSTWEVGRDYERFIGFELERLGYQVDYFGAIEGFDDLGRDLIAKKKGSIKIIQCKYWSQHKEIHEKHIFQLFGSVVEYIAREKLGRDNFDLFSSFEKFTEIHPELVTSTKLSSRARQFAAILNVKVRELQPIGEYPMIKCNISRRGGEKVYHLPFDQQYDRTRIEPQSGERYVSTTVEAENLGFRRAFRWKPA